MKTKSSLDVLYNKQRTLEEWAKHEGRCLSGQTVAEVAKIFVISLCCYVFDIPFLISIYQIENINNCITLLKEDWSLGAQEDRTALYGRVLSSRQITMQSGSRQITMQSSLLGPKDQTPFSKVMQLQSSPVNLRGR